MHDAPLGIFSLSSRGGVGSDGRGAVGALLMCTHKTITTLTDHENRLSCDGDREKEAGMISETRVAWQIGLGIKQCKKSSDN